MQHWKEGGHDKLCKPIKKAGGAEQYNANNKYSEAVAVAAKACAEDTKGQKCYICTEAVHRHTGEGLVRGCACHTTEGFVHVSCLAEQAKILVAEAEENNLGPKVFDERFDRWVTCSLCKQRYYGVVWCALGWACWKTYVGRPETDEVRHHAMGWLAGGLYGVERHEEALSVQEAELSLMRRAGRHEGNITANMLTMQGNLANTYQKLGRRQDALRLRREVYSGRLQLFGEEHIDTLSGADNYANGLIDLNRFEEARSLLRRTVPVARRVLGESNNITLRMRCLYAASLYQDPAATLDDMRESVTMFEETGRTAQRVMGGANPLTMGMERHLGLARMALHARETPSPRGAA